MAADRGDMERPIGGRWLKMNRVLSDKAWHRARLLSGVKLSALEERKGKGKPCKASKMKEANFYSSANICAFCGVGRYLHKK